MVQMSNEYPYHGDDSPRDQLSVHNNTFENSPSFTQPDNNYHNKSHRPPSSSGNSNKSSSRHSPPGEYHTLENRHSTLRSDYLSGATNSSSLLRVRSDAGKPPSIVSSKLVSNQNGSGNGSMSSFDASKILAEVRKRTYPSKSIGSMSSGMNSPSVAGTSSASDISMVSNPSNDVNSKEDLQILSPDWNIHPVTNPNTSNHGEGWNIPPVGSRNQHIDDGETQPSLPSKVNEDADVLSVNSSLSNDSVDDSTRGGSCGSAHGSRKMNKNDSRGNKMEPKSEPVIPDPFSFMLNCSSSDDEEDEKDVNLTDVDKNTVSNYSEDGDSELMVDFPTARGDFEDEPMYLSVTELAKKRAADKKAMREAENTGADDDLDAVLRPWRKVSVEVSKEEQDEHEDEVASSIPDSELSHNIMLDMHINVNSSHCKTMRRLASFDFDRDMEDGDYNEGNVIQEKKRLSGISMNEFDYDVPRGGSVSDESKDSEPLLPDFAMTQSGRSLLPPESRQALAALVVDKKLEEDRQYYRLNSGAASNQYEEDLFDDDDHDHDDDFFTEKNAERRPSPSPIAAGRSVGGKSFSNKSLLSTATPPLSRLPSKDEDTASPAVRHGGMEKLGSDWDIIDRNPTATTVQNRKGVMKKRLSSSGSQARSKSMDRDLNDMDAASSSDRSNTAGLNPSSNANASNLEQKLKALGRSSTHDSEKDDTESLVSKMSNNLRGNQLVSQSSMRLSKNGLTDSNPSSDDKEETKNDETKPNSTPDEKPHPARRRSSLNSARSSVNSIRTERRSNAKQKTKVEIDNLPPEAGSKPNSDDAETSTVSKSRSLGSGLVRRASITQLTNLFLGDNSDASSRLDSNTLDSNAPSRPPDDLFNDFEVRNKRSRGKRVFGPCVWHYRKILLMVLTLSLGLIVLLSLAFVFLYNQNKLFAANNPTVSLEVEPGSPTMAPTSHDHWEKVGDAINGSGEGDIFGSSVSLNKIGDYMAVGASMSASNGKSSSGAVTVYKFETGGWEPFGNVISGMQADDRAGYSVNISENGTVVAIGSRYHNGPNGMKSGQARVFQYDDINNTWNKLGRDIDGKAQNDEAGFCVSLSSDGRRIAVGAIGNGKNGTSSGSVRVFEYRDEWILLGKALMGDEGDFFGTSISLSSDGDVLAVGAPRHGENGVDSGLVKVYKYDNDTRQYKQHGNSIQGKNATDWAGRAVSLSLDGNRVAVGSYNSSSNGENSGHTSVYEFNDEKWDQLGSDIQGEAKSESGGALSLSSDGSRLAIGAARFGQGDRSERGLVRIYLYDEQGGWSQSGEDLYGDKKQDRAGNTVAFSGNGKILAMGVLGSDSNGKNSGQVRVYGERLSITPQSATERARLRKREKLVDANR